MAQSQPAWPPRAGQVSPQAAAFAQRVLLPLVQVLWRPTLNGLENLPLGPFLLVANHSAGIGLAELLSFGALYVVQAGPDRPLAGYAQSTSFALWPMSKVHQHLGTIPSTYEAAHQTLQQGVPILVFPGGDHESLQPVWTPNHVDFCGRVGFLKIARQHGVPIVPLGIRNGAFTAPILYRAKWMATALVLPRWLFGVKRWAISLLAVFGCAGLLWLPLPLWLRLLLCWAWLGSPLTFLPWVPWTLRFRIGAPLQLGEGELADELAKVEAAVQAMVDAA